VRSLFYLTNYGYNKAVLGLLIEGEIMNARTETVRAKVSHDTKVAAEIVLNELGLTMSEAINLMLVQVKMRKALPFKIAIPKEPNPETRRALEETDGGIGLIKCKDIDDLFEQLDID
jgi:DNA-damage-inducible protein J